MIQRSLLDDPESVLDDTKVGLDDTKVSGRFIVYEFTFLRGKWDRFTAVNGVRLPR